ncbi:MAG: four helix bundle protein [Candidatus Buchananbacteria bacterium]|jgi:four helix bundle protein
MNSYQEALKSKMDSFVHFIYKITKNFPREELYSSVSQIRRASLSVILNYIEGYARNGNRSRIAFLDISYGSLMESDYLLSFAKDEQYIINEDFIEAKKLSHEIGAMLYTEMCNLKRLQD